LNEALEKLIQTKEDQKDLWMKCLDNARSILHARDITDLELEKIFVASSTPEKFNTVIKLVYEFTRTNPNGHLAVKLLFNQADTSHYTLNDWIEGINFFNSWLLKNDRKTGWKMMLGYLACCSESPENKDVKHKFNDLINDMLKAHGFDG
jgi:hypothetical protein